MRELRIRAEAPARLPEDGRGAVVTIGTFDGVHRGHWAVLREISRRAASADRRSVLLTFDPHPLRIVRPEIAPPLLTTPEEKREILEGSGLDDLVTVHFTAELSRLSPREFVEQLLVPCLGVQELVIGYDHGFGRGRSGDAETLRELGRELGFTVDVVGPVEDGGGAISSTRIRGAVQEGRLEEARSGLGRPYSFRGRVVRGEGRGRRLGFPTANLEVSHPDKLLPPPGVYAVRGARLEGSRDGALHVGPRPTFEGSPPSLELHLIDFEGDLYGEEIRVDLVRYLRSIEAYPSVEALVEQIALDVEHARALLAEDRGSAT